MGRLDILLLKRAVEELRDKTNQPEIQTHRPQSIDGCYMLCTLCRGEKLLIRHFDILISVRSYANGTWVGDIPDELQGLTFLEEQCIAHATCCMFKLEVGPTGQFASRGNVCVFAQDPGPLVTTLPPPPESIT